jgi:long-subunit fatty acid transport protein
MYKIISIILMILSQNLNAAVISSDSNKDNIYQAGVGITLMKKNILITDIISNENIISKDEAKDNIFVNHKIFFDYFSGGDADIDYQYGLGFDFGYGYKKWDFFTGLGFIRAAFEYEYNNQITNYQKNSIYYTIGTAYKFSNNLSVRLSAKTYDIDFSNSDGDKVSLRNNNLNLVFGVGF